MTWRRVEAYWLMTSSADHMAHGAKDAAEPMKIAERHLAIAVLNIVMPGSTSGARNLVFLPSYVT